MTKPMLVLAALMAFSLAGAVAQAEEIRPSEAACDSKKMGGGELAECLRKAAEHADNDVRAAVEAAVKSIDGRQGVLSKQRARWRRSLNEAQAQWYAWRDTECQDVAPFEAGVAGRGADPRLACIIDYDAARVASLKSRYP